MDEPGHQLERQLLTVAARIPLQPCPEEERERVHALELPLQRLLRIRNGVQLRQEACAELLIEQPGRFVVEEEDASAIEIHRPLSALQFEVHAEV